MPNGLPFSKETFRKLDSAESKLDALFDVLVHMTESDFECSEDRDAFRTACQARITALEKSDIKTKGISAITGAITGAVTAFLQKPLF